jgi:hypothetical protein
MAMNCRDFPTHWSVFLVVLETWLPFSLRQSNLITVLQKIEKNIVLQARHGVHSSAKI